MLANEPTKIFLSHKGSDKELVVRFKKVLDELGFETWLDDDAMPAGTELERGLLEGFRDSCAAVFFVTASFRDEGFLSTEINYAIREKRAKGDKFAIITLQFAEGSLRPNIPDLLQTYVWKTPETELDALYEIVRAVPVICLGIEWRDVGPSVSREYVSVFTNPELSEEACTILKQAATSDGTILYLRTFGGQFIQAGSESLIPNDEPRTIARWTAGLDDLVRHGYIKHVSGSMFEVTLDTRP